MDAATRSRLFTALSLALVVIVFILLLAASYTSALVLLAGGLAAAAIYALARLAHRMQQRGQGRLLLIVGAAILALALVVVVFALTMRGESQYPSILVEDVSVTSYALTLRRSDGGKLSASEDAVLTAQPGGTGPVINIPPVKKTSAATIISKGWLLREAVITPLAGTTIMLPDGFEVDAQFIITANSRLNVKLQNFPKGSFYAARDAIGLSSSPYLDTETVTWTISNMDDDIAFAYIPSPFHYLRPLLAPFVSLSSLSQWLFGLIGIVLGGLVSGYMKAGLTTAAQKAVGRITRPPAKPAAPPENNDD